MNGGKREIWLRETWYGVIYPAHWKALALFAAGVVALSAAFVLLPFGGAVAAGAAIFLGMVVVCAFHTGSAKADG